MALGARGQDVLGLLMRESMVLVAAGVAIRTRRGHPSQSSRRDAPSTASPRPTLSRWREQIAVMVTVSALAGALPARRAIRINPIAALRHE